MKDDTSAARFTLRINTDLLNKVKAEAKKQKRSGAKEIEYALETYYRTLKTE